MNVCQNVFNPGGHHNVLLQCKVNPAQAGGQYNQGGEGDENSVTNSNKIS